MAVVGSKVTTFEAFKEQAFGNTGTVYSPVFSFDGSFAAGIIGAQGVADAASSGVLVVTIEGSQDGINFDTAGNLLTGLASDGAHDFAQLDWSAEAYQFFRIKGTENGTDTIASVNVWVTIR